MNELKPILDLAASPGDAVSVHGVPTRRVQLVPWFRRLVAALALGAATTAAVAWGCAIWAPQTDFSPVPPLLNNPPRLAQPLPTDGHVKGWRMEWGFGTFAAEPYQRFGGDPGEYEGKLGCPAEGAYVRRVGWPTYALQSNVARHLDSWPGQPRRWQLPLREIISRGLNSDDLPRRLLAQPQRRLALIPLPGFAVNAALYGALWFAGMAAWRRRRPRETASRGFAIGSPR